jgi:chromosomal replication initiation ATPase DnaA
MNIFQAVTNVYDITYHDLISTSRKRHLVDARKQIIGRVYQKGVISLTTLGRLFNRDHSTIYDSLQGHKALLQYDAEYQEKARQIEELIDENQ